MSLINTGWLGVFEDPVWSQLSGCPCIRNLAATHRTAILRYWLLVSILYQGLKLRRAIQSSSRTSQVFPCAASAFMLLEAHGWSLCLGDSRGRLSRWQETHGTVWLRERTLGVLQNGPENAPTEQAHWPCAVSKLNGSQIRFCEVETTLKITFGPNVPFPSHRNCNFDQINTERYDFSFLAMVCLGMWQKDFSRLCFQRAFTF